MPFLKDKRKLLSNSRKLNELTKKKGLRHAVLNTAGDRYTGEWDDNVKAGKGTLLSRKRKLYEGDWGYNVRHGFGVFALPKDKLFRLYYRGDWVEGKECGFGERHYPKGGFFVGYWRNGKRYGYGQMWYANGAYYDGGWKDDKRHGLGMWVKSDGNRYEGHWVHDLKHGRGRFFHLDSGQMQEGVWRDDICIYSFVVDIPFRQTAVQPTLYPIQIVELSDLKDVCDRREQWALGDNVLSCLKLCDSIPSNGSALVHSRYRHCGCKQYPPRRA